MRSTAFIAEETDCFRLVGPLWDSVFVIVGQSIEILVVVEGGNLLVVVLGTLRELLGVGGAAFRLSPHGFFFFFFFFFWMPFYLSIYLSICPFISISLWVSGGGVFSPV